MHGKAPGVRKLACAFSKILFMMSLKAAQAAALQGSLRAQAIDTDLKNEFPTGEPKKAFCYEQFRSMLFHPSKTNGQRFRSCTSPISIDLEKDKT